MFLLGLWIKQTKKCISIHKTKYMKEFLKNFKLDYVKQMKMFMHLTMSLEVDEKF